MNIFVVDRDPIIAARQLCNKHVYKMHTESVQMLVQCMNDFGIKHNVRNKDGSHHKGGHPHHPCTKWVQESYANFKWLLAHAYELTFEHSRRRDGFVPMSQGQLTQLAWLIPQVLEHLPAHGGLTPFALAMPDEYRGDDPVESYRAYYIGEKAYMAQWPDGKTPDWYAEAFEYAGVE